MIRLAAPPMGGARLIVRANPYLRADSLPELLAWDDVDFVRCAYVTVLGRQPDAQGEAYYTARLRNGYSKLELLRQMRSSSEASDHDPGIAGFDRALRRASLQAMPAIGWLFRLIWPPLDSIAAGERRFRAAMNAIAVNRSAIAALGVNVQSASDSGPGGHDAPAPAGAAGEEPAAALPAGTPDPHLEHLALDDPLASFFAQRAT